MNPTHDDNRLTEKYGQQDLTDSKHDQELLKGDEATIDLPDVTDIPGQENVHPPHLSEYADTTASSADEEADDLFDDEAESDDSNVSAIEKRMLKEGAEQTPNDEEAEDVKNAALDDIDNDGSLLEEKGLEDDMFGEDLDLPQDEETTEEESE
jgi:hypothetical protein